LRNNTMLQKERWTHQHVEKHELLDKVFVHLLYKFKPAYVGNAMDEITWKMLIHINLALKLSLITIHLVEIGPSLSKLRTYQDGHNLDILNTCLENFHKM
jgi:hypothetical protein